MTPEAELLEANAAFYAAFQSLERSRMESIWLRSPLVQCTHPGWVRLSGYDAILESWEGIFLSALEMQIEITDLEATVRGELGWVCCTENLRANTVGGPGRSRVEATNIFERRDGRWWLVNHHGSPIAAGGEVGGPPPSVH